MVHIHRLRRVDAFAQRFEELGVRGLIVAESLVMLKRFPV